MDEPSVVSILRNYPANSWHFAGFTFHSAIDVKATCINPKGAKVFVWVRGHRRSNEWGGADYWEVRGSVAVDDAIVFSEELSWDLDESALWMWIAPIFLKSKTDGDDERKRLVSEKQQAEERAFGEARTRGLRKL